MRKDGFQKSAVLLLTILMVIIFYSCHSKEDDEQVTANTGTPVKIVHPVSKTMMNYLQLSGTTVFLKKEIVRAPLQGYIKKAFKNIGDFIKAGDLLFQIQTKESYDINGPSDKNNDVIYIPIKANSNGILTQLNYYSGEYITDGEQLAVIANSSSLVVRLNVPYQNSQEVKIGERCDLLLPDKRVLKGLIVRSVPSVDSIAQTQTFIINFSGQVNIPENLNVIIRIPTNVLNNAVVVPKSTVLSNETLSNFWIMKLINDTTSIKVNIKKGLEDDSLVQILSPKLTNEDRIVSAGGYGLPDTAKVVIEKQ